MPNVEADIPSSSEDEYVNDLNDDESYESEEDDGSGRTLLFLCEEGQLDIAPNRVSEWDEQFPLPGTAAITIPPAAAIVSTTEATIEQELFRKNPGTGNYCLHEILAGGTSGTSAPELAERLVRRYRSKTSFTNHDYRKIFMAQPKTGSNGRTILHWCAWSKTSPKILRLVLDACPEAMCLRDNKSHFSRTPLEIAQRYWPDDEITTILKSSLETYLPYRVRFCVRLCAERLFLKPCATATIDSMRDSKTMDTTNQTLSEASLVVLKPFDKKDRRIAGLAPRPWFVMSVLGYALQREMKGLALCVLSFAGCGAKLETKNRRKTKKGKSRPAKRNGAGKDTSRTVKASAQANSKGRGKRRKV